MYKLLLILMFHFFQQKTFPHFRVFGTTETLVNGSKPNKVKNKNVLYILGVENVFRNVTYLTSHHK